MNKNQTLDIILTMDTCYNGMFTRNNSNPFLSNLDPNERIVKTVEIWHEILADYEFDVIMKNLKEHIKTSSYPPKISDVVPRKEKRLQNIPDIEETKKLLGSNFVENPVTPEEMKKILEEKLGKEWVRALEQRKRVK